MKGVSVDHGLHQIPDSVAKEPRTFVEHDWAELPGERHSFAKYWHAIPEIRDNM
jgi:hypothetical protein